MSRIIQITIASDRKILLSHEQMTNCNTIAWLWWYQCGLQKQWLE